jgi:hypothetical protein
MTRILPLILLLLSATAAVGQESFSTIEERMTGKEFSETGLSKLSPDELAALNEWLRSHSVATLEDARYSPATATAAAAAASGDTRGFEDKHDWDSDAAIVSRIKGEFSGWEGDGTVIELENGMVWKTAERSQFVIPPQEGLLATIDKGMFGGWRLEVEGYNKSVVVKRIK